MNSGSTPKLPAIYKFNVGWTYALVPDTSDSLVGMTLCNPRDPRAFATIIKVDRIKGHVTLQVFDEEEYNKNMPLPEGVI